MEQKNLSSNITISNTDTEDLENKTSTSSTIDAEELLNWCLVNKKLNVQKIETPIDHYTLNDIRIKNRMQEDDTFLKDRDIYKRIRRGNCIASYYQDNLIHYKIVRKGLVKFFDYRKEYKAKFRDEEKFVLNPVKKVFSENSKNSTSNFLQVYITEKANGENAQIAYEPLHNAWIVGSKNVTIVVRNLEDIKWYITDKQKAQKFSFCAEFAELWFQILEKKIISKNLYDDFINDIKGYTLIAENVGDLKHQHIKLYDEKDLIFYGMIKNDSSDISESVNKSYDLIDKKYGLNFVSVTKSEKLYTYEEAIKYLNEIYVEVLKRDVIVGGEGSVAYFVEVDGKTGDEKVVSMAKLKTFEYRFLRKLREKLKTFSKNIVDVDREKNDLKNDKNGKKKYDRGDAEFVLKKIEKECNEILGEEGDDLDLSEWLKFGGFVLNFVSMNKEKCDFASMYATFIYEMKDLYEKKKQDKSFKIDEELVKKICQKYIYKADEGMNNDEDEEEGNSNSLKNKNNSKSLQNENLINTNYSNNLSGTVTTHNTTNDDPEAKLKFEENKKTKIVASLKNHSLKTFKKGNVYFFINSGLVGGGKSTLYGILEKVIATEYSELINLLYISSDKMRENLIKEYLEENPTATKDQAFDKTAKNSKKLFNEEIFNILDSSKSDEKINIFYVDKNFPGDSIEGFYKEMYPYDKKLSFDYVVFHPYIANSINLNKFCRYPFSMNYFIQCYYRLKDRKHETLDFEQNPTAHYILIAFLTLYAGHRFSSNNDKILMNPLSFTDEKEISYPENFLNKFQEMMKKVGRKGFDGKFMNEISYDINGFFDMVESMYSRELFEDTRDILANEIKNFMQVKIYGKINEEELFGKDNDHFTESNKMVIDG